ncbi:hypothetical protein [Pseudochryseolinea flava]|nr:hypothetical protein [Pseudochryseolinea flava]
MKTLINILAIFFLFLSTHALANDREESDYEKERQRNLFVMKAEKKFRGARVEVLSANGNVITSGNLEKRKVVIDFNAVKFGTYTIRVSKGDETKEFHFVKR